MRVAIVTETFLPKMDGIVRMLSELLAYGHYWLAYEKYDRRRAGARALLGTRHDRAANVAWRAPQDTIGAGTVNRAFTAILRALTTR